jgi:hypothetical protein
MWSQRLTYIFFMFLSLPVSNNTAHLKLNQYSLYLLWYPAKYKHQI